MSQSRSRHLNFYQQKFVASFLHPGAPRYQRLVAPPGSGKTSVALAVAQRMLAEESASRLLILVETVVLAEAYVHFLREEAGGIRAVRVDRQVYRELEASVPVGQTPWQPGIVSVMTMALPRQQDIAESLAETNWDLVVVDESRSLGEAGRALIEQLVDARVVGRLLLVTGKPSELVGDLSIPGLETTTWTYDVLLPELRVAAPRLEIVEYRRTEEEIELLHRVIELAEETVDSRVGRFTTSVLLHRASSSLAAAEKSIRRQRNRLTHGDFLSTVEGEPQVEQGAAEAAGNRLDVWSQPRTALVKVAEALSALEEIPVDAKLQALLGLVNRLSTGRRDKRVAVFSSYADTILYLRQSLEELNESLYCVMGDLTYEERGSVFDEWRARGGILLLTDAALVGLDLKGLEHAILYDLPRGRKQLARLSGLFYRASYGVQLSVYAFRDSSGAIPEETDALHRLLQLIEEFE